MIWKINQWHFNSVKQTLSAGVHVFRLEPIQSEVLLYLCKNAQKIVSRDEFLEHVWQGQLVTENAVNKVIAKLRKSLGDEDKLRQFIVTHPKKGYKLIADTVCLQTTNQPNKTTFLRPYYRHLFVTLIILALVGSLAWLSQTKDNKYTKAVALTRSGGGEYQPAISPDGQYLIYSAFENQTYNLYLKNLSNEQQILISDGIGDATSGNWSFDGHQLIYIYTYKELCEFRLLKITDGVVKNQQRVHNCPPKSFGKVAFTHDSNRIIYSERSDTKSPYFLFSMDLTTSDKKKLNQPPTFLAGNAEFDIHPHENKLLISSPDEQQWLAFYQLNLNTDEIKYLFKKDEHLCCAIWSHSGNEIVTMNAHPSNGIMQMDLQGKNIKTIYESTHHVRKPIRVQSDKTYIYSGGINNFDIKKYDINHKSDVTVANSSDTDELPRLSSDEKLLGFISRRSGASQVWSNNLVTGHIQPITDFTDQAKYYDFQWSPNDKYIAALMINGIKLIASDTGETSLLKIPQKELRGLSWLDEKTIAFSQKSNKKWRVHHYNILTSSLTLADQKWAYINYHKDPKYTAFIDHKNQLYINNHKIELAGNTKLMLYRRFGFQVDSGSIYHYHEEQQSLALYQTDITSSQSTRLMALGHNGFDVGLDSVFYSHLNSRTADIFKTLY